MPPTSVPVIAVIGLITQLKISFRQISVLMSADTRPSRPAAVSIAAIAALCGPSSSSV